MYSKTVKRREVNNMTESKYREINSGIGSRLKKIREENGLKQSDVAYTMEVGLKQYQRYESGENAIPLAKLQLLRREYQFSLDYLIMGKKEEFDIDLYVVGLSWNEKCKLFARMNDYMLLLMKRYGKNFEEDQ